MTGVDRKTIRGYQGRLDAGVQANSSGGNLPATGLQARRAPAAFARAQARAHVLRRPASVPDACSIPSGTIEQDKTGHPFRGSPLCLDGGGRATRRKRYELKHLQRLRNVADRREMRPTLTDRSLGTEGQGACTASATRTVDPAGSIPFAAIEPRSAHGHPSART